MKIAPVADVKARFSSYLKESESGPIVVTRNGKAVAVLISMEDEEELERIILAYSPKFQSILTQQVQKYSLQVLPQPGFHWAKKRSRHCCRNSPPVTFGPPLLKGGGGDF